MKRPLVRTIVGLFALSLASPTLWAQDTVQPVQPVPQDQAAQDQQGQGQPAPIYSQEQLDQMLAPIALYPDQLLGQILMAATYPLEIVQADRWVKDPNNAQLKGDQLAAALQQIDWDPSVKSLVPFPQILAMMDGRVDWTQRLGDAFLAQQADVMNSVQRLRQQALAAGNLRTTPQQTVTPVDQSIVIQPANPQVVYVPVYNPTVVYGAWAYPAYPPIYFPPPPGFYVGPAIVAGIGFSIGFGIVDEFWGWNSWDWDHHLIRVDHDRFNTINNYFIVHDSRPRFDHDVWAHDAYHRRGVAYRDPVSHRQFRPTAASSPDARRDFRGYNNAPAPGAQPNRTNARPVNAPSAANAHPGGGPQPNQPGGQHPPQTAQVQHAPPQTAQVQHAPPQTAQVQHAPPQTAQRPPTAAQTQHAPPQTAQHPQGTAPKPPTATPTTLVRPATTQHTPSPTFQGSSKNATEAAAHAQRGHESLQSMQSHVTPTRGTAPPKAATPPHNASTAGGNKGGASQQQPKKP
jgi:hypothetical protein